MQSLTQEMVGPGAGTTRVGAAGAGQHPVPGAAAGSLGVRVEFVSQRQGSIAAADGRVGGPQERHQLLPEPARAGPASALDSHAQ
eukprot:3512161-Rhodomonas_salina.2